MPAVGLLGPGDLEAVARLARLGFGHPRELFDRYLALFGSETLRALRSDAGEPAAIAAVWPMDQWFGGRPVPAQAAALVTVDPAERGRGLGSGLMRGILEEARQNGAALSMLHPATLPFYARLGYGRGGVAIDWSAPPTILPVDSAVEGSITRLPLRDATPLTMLRRAMLASENGLAERTEAMWSLALSTAEGEPAEIVLLGGLGGPEGYVSLAPPIGRRLTVTDWCLPTRRSLLLASRLFAGYRAQVDLVCWRGGPDDPLALLATDNGVRIDGRDDWLLRILDLRTALESRGYPGDLSAVLVLDVTDPLFAANTGLFSLTISQGCGNVTQLWEEPVEVLTLGIAALASLYSGHADASTLFTAGLLRGSRQAVELAARIFSGPRPWMPDRF